MPPTPTMIAEKPMGAGVWMQETAFCPHLPLLKLNKGTEKSLDAHERNSSVSPEACIFPYTES